jgi:hypothetical protein
MGAHQKRGRTVGMIIRAIAIAWHPTAKKAQD